MEEPDASSKDTPRRLGRYLLLSRLRQGGMTEVWTARLAEEVGPARPLVIKILPQSMSEIREAQARFLEEARIVLNLTHGNIATAFEFGRADERPFLVMEYVPGPSLRSLLDRLKEKGESMKAADALFVAREVARALAYAHSFSETDASGGLIHRDISPDNILISTAGQVKLTDFGIATFLDSGLLGSVWGKASYVAPEVARGEPASPQSDLYSLGVVLFECLAGKPPFRGESDGETLKLIQNAYPKPLLEYRSDIHFQVESFALGLLSKDPARRPASASQAEIGLRSLLDKEHPAYTETVLAKTISSHFSKDDFLDESAGARLRAGMSGAGMDLEGGWSTAELLATRTVPLGESPTRERVEKKASSAKINGKSRVRWVAVSVASVLVLSLIALWKLVPDKGEEKAESVSAADDKPAIDTTKPPAPWKPQKKEPQPSAATEPPDDKEIAAPIKTTGAAIQITKKGGKKQKAIEADRKSIEKQAEFGWLNINSQPWSYVSVDGKRLEGHTPYRKIKVKSGHHELVFENPQLMLKTSKDVQVKAWEEINVGVRLE